MVLTGSQRAAHEAKLARATAKAAAASMARDDAIREAHKAGMSVRAIAAEAGISFQRVHQILHNR